MIPGTSHRAMRSPWWRRSVRNRVSSPREACKRWMADVGLAGFYKDLQKRLKQKDRTR